MAQAKTPFQVKRGGGASRTSMVKAMAAVGRTVDVRTVAHSPKNPASRVVEDDEMQELIQSVKSNGVVQPIVVFPTETWKVTYPEDQIEATAEWVVVMGNRRVHAALAAERFEVPVLVRDDPEKATLLMLVENLQRKDLGPLDEARGYAELLAAGATYDELASEVGRSKGHISKRMTLLKLGPLGQQCIEEGEWRVTDVVERATDLTPQMIASLEGVLGESEHRDRDFLSCLWSAQDRRDTQEREQAAIRVGEALGIPVAKDGKKVATWTFLGRVLLDEEPSQELVEQVQAASTETVVSVPQWGTSVHVYAKPPKGDDQAKSRDDAERAFAKEAAAAAKARQEWVRDRYLTRKVPAADLRAALAEHVLHCDLFRRDALWGVGQLLDMGGGSDRYYGPSSETMNWFNQGVEDDPERTAFILALGSGEATVSGTLTRPGLTDHGCRYIERLQAAGYEPTSWELEQIKKHKQDVQDGGAK